MDDSLHIPFRPCPLILEQASCKVNNSTYDCNIPSYIFPSCMPYDYSEYKKGKHFCIPPDSIHTISDMYRIIRCKFRLKVFYVVNLRMKQSNLANELWLPLQGGPTAVISPSKINHVLHEILRRCPSTFIVHCSHGINRTLLIIAAMYLLQYPAKSVDAALHHVKKIRPPGILRSNVVDSLKLWYKHRKKNCSQ